MRTVIALAVLASLVGLLAIAPPASADLPKCPAEFGRGQMWGAAVSFDREAESCRLYYETWGEFHYDKECLA